MTQEIPLLICETDVLGADVSYSNLFLERYIKLLAWMQAQNLFADAGDAISIRNEGMAARIEELTHRVLHKTRKLHALENRLAMLLEAKLVLALAGLMNFGFKVRNVWLPSKRENLTSTYSLNQTTTAVYRKERDTQKTYSVELRKDER